MGSSTFPHMANVPLPPPRPQMANVPLPPPRPQMPQTIVSRGFQRPTTPYQMPPGARGTGIQGYRPDVAKTILADREALGKLGYNPNAQAAILGNIRQESNFDPRIYTSGGDAGTAHGQFQWRADRLRAFKSYAQRMGLDPNSPAVQVDYMNREVSAMPGLKERLNRSDPSSGAMLFGRMFERPKVVEPIRARYAKQFFGGAQDSPASGGRSMPSSPEQSASMPSVDRTGGHSKPPEPQYEEKRGRKGSGGGGEAQQPTTPPPDLSGIVTTPPPSVQPWQQQPLPPLAGPQPRPPMMLRPPEPRQPGEGFKGRKPWEIFASGGEAA
jgi:Phage tail lysozyme